MHRPGFESADPGRGRLLSPDVVSASGPIRTSLVAVTLVGCEGFQLRAVGVLVEEARRGPAVAAPFWWV